MINDILYKITEENFETFLKKQKYDPSTVLTEDSANEARLAMISINSPIWQEFNAVMPMDEFTVYAAFIMGVKYGAELLRLESLNTNVSSK